MVCFQGPVGRVCSPLQVYLARTQHSCMYACGTCGCLCCMCDDVQLEGQLNAGDAGEGDQAVVAEQRTRLPTACSSRQCKTLQTQGQKKSRAWFRQAWVVCLCPPRRCSSYANTAARANQTAALCTLWHSRRLSCRSLHPAASQLNRFVLMLVSHASLAFMAAEMSALTVTGCAHH
jgi:hypothetical protein